MRQRHSTRTATCVLQRDIGSYTPEEPLDAQITALDYIPYASTALHDANGDDGHICLSKTAFADCEQAV